MDCESPRRDRIWDIGDAPGNCPHGRKEMKFIGFYTIYIREPSSIADIGGLVDADIIWFGSEAKCNDGSPFQPVGSTTPSSGRLARPG